MSDPLPVGAVLVGVDGSAAGDLAADWAATEAAHEHLPLVLLHAAPTPLPSSTWLETRGSERREATHQLRDQGRKLLVERCERLRRSHPGLDVRHVVRLEDPRDALLGPAGDARMVVVGTRGLGRVRSLLVGSVSGAVARHAPCPAVVVRDTGAADRPAGVVAGVADGPDEAETHAVLALAFEVAEARSLPLTVLHCSWADPDVGPDLERVREAVARHGAAHPPVSVRIDTARGYADEHLVRASGDAALVVVGRRHQPFLGQLVYGSVAPVVVEHARCSVAVVPVGT